ncbi:hypothetical protein WKW77_06190 [Variovorax ureilyticus]|uniref:Dolichyl-phosphate-mannose-protein mannosyltransferase n=1 Tax=Variovorax ureilyticus TaxID=1836198 RepID=A0ABU8VC97_9BURK
MMKAVSLAGCAVLGLLALLVAMAMAQQPFATNDGPVHLAFADLIAHLHDDQGRALQREAYRVDLRLTPNLLPYLLMAGLVELSSVRIAESIVQLLCLLAPTIAAWCALRAIRRDNAWLAIFVFPLSLNQLFFLGLYNYCLSTAVFFLVVAAFWKLQEARSLAWSVGLGALLSLELTTHAGGFVAAMAGVGALTAGHVALAWRRERAGPVAALMQQWRAILAMLIPLPLLWMSLSESAGTPVLFGPGPWERAISAGRLSILRQTGGADSIIALALSLGLAASLAWAVVRIIRQGSRLPDRAVDAMVATLAALAVSVVLMFAFPDTMGGGWTHFYRLILFPYFWIVLLLAQQSFSARAAWGLLGFVSAVSFALLGSTMKNEALVRAQMEPLRQVDRLVGAHCTVLPVVLESRPVDSTGGAIATTRMPYFQNASRLEAHDDRLVLFNYLARLPNYPVRFLPQVEPQRLIFHWPPHYRGTTFDAVDVAGFEKASGIPVDYLLLIGDPRRQEGALGEGLRLLTAPSQPLFASPDHRVSLYLRPRQPNSRCVPAPAGEP